MTGRPAGRARVEDALAANAADLLGYAERRVGRHDAPDALTEIMLVAWRRADVVPQDALAARMWLFGVARGVVANAARGQLRRTRLAERLRGAVAAGPPQAGLPADHGLEVRDAIDRLGPELAEVVRLVHWDGFALAEVAELLGLPASTVRSRYRQARVRLAEALFVHDGRQFPGGLTPR